MQDAITRAKSLKRPGLLSNAARQLADCQSHGRALKRIGLPETNQGPAQRLTNLLDSEAEMDLQRREASPHYNALRHIEFLAAVIAETRHHLTI